ncbi:MAG: glutathione S-transferase family protein [Deltaproteobacteria bacterium]|nr:glutathione S-transferase family protein [Deltaproteobacteria bacterium]
MIRLYQTSGSPFCHRVRIVLAEKELDYQTVNIELSKGDHKTEQFLRLNPMAKVPVLADDDLILGESLLINEYLNEEYPFPELLPEEPGHKAQARWWAAQADQLVGQSFLKLFFLTQAQERNEPYEAGDFDIMKKNVVKFLEIADRALKGKEFLAGSYSLADIAFAPFISRYERYQIQIPENLTNALAWMKRLSTRHTVVST